MKIYRSIFTALFLSLTLLSCKNKKNIEVPAETPTVQITSSHAWYYFSNEGYSKVDKIQNVPHSAFLPWTEAFRISSANCGIYNSEGTNKAFGIANRLGILIFENDKITLAKDDNIFADRTAGNLVFLNGTPIFSVFKSAFFNDTIKDEKYSASDSQHLFLIQLDSESKIAYPIINCNNLIKEPNSEITDFYWDGLNWLCCVKTITPKKTEFSYISWKPIPSLLTLSPVNADANISITPSTQEEFRSLKEQIDYSFAPERIKKMLEGFSSKTNFCINVKNSGGSSWHNYENKAAGNKPALFATAILAQSWSAALFEDGTLFLEGALPGKHILRNGKPVAIRLPKLPADFVYSDFVISGTTLYAAWEETAFYKTGRSGFLAVNLDKTLYSKML